MRLSVQFDRGGIFLPSLWTQLGPNHLHGGGPDCPGLGDQSSENPRGGGSSSRQGCWREHSPSNPGKRISQAGGFISAIRRGHVPHTTQRVELQGPEKPLPEFERFNGPL